MSTEIKMHNVRAMSFSFIWGLPEDDIAQEPPSQRALRNGSQ